MELAIYDAKEGDIGYVQKNIVEKVLDVVAHAKNLIEALANSNTTLLQDEWQKVFDAERKADEVQESHTLRAQ